MSSAHAIPAAMNAPMVLRAKTVQPVAASATRTVRAAHNPASKVPVKAWGARVDYDHSIDRPDLLVEATRNNETSRPAFATLKRSFGTGEFRPYVGVGVGQASAKFDAIDPGTEDGYAVKGVVGGNLIFSEAVGGYVQYDYAVASENSALTDDDKSHGISFGLSISLN